MVSIIVPTLGRASLDRLLRSILRAVQNQKLAWEQDVEVVVCVDHRGSLVLHSEFKNVHVVPSDGAGVNRARNSGARASRGDILWFLDDDTEICNDTSLKELPSFFEDSKVHALGGEYLSTTAASFSERGYNSLCSMWRTSAGQVDAEQLLGGTLAVRRSSWEQVGGFDDTIEYGGAETSFVAKLNRQEEANLGQVRFHEGLNVWHFAGDRGVVGWVRIASVQGGRKPETAQTLPKFSHRARRTIEFLRRQNSRDLISLTCFGIPFLTVSRVAALLRR